MMWKHTNSGGRKPEWEVTMKERSGIVNRRVVGGLAMLLALTVCGCVSVQESGTKVTSAPPPTTNVMFHSEPSNAEVFVNGQFRGSTPVNLHLAAGTHKIELRLEGFQEWERELVVVAGDDTRVAATLQPE
jgi:hypothetical protein